MKEVTQFLSDCNIFYLATLEDDQPRVRPFGAVVEFEGKTYICTNNKKNVFAQILANPKVEVSATDSNGRWIRVTGKLIPDSRREAKEAMLNANPGLEKMYSVDDDKFEVLYFTEGNATVYSFSADPVEYVL
ncbi:MAG: NimC/NimA family protein [Anaerocolumna sp.]|jgi:uncharacterized pyridoxamine 5'-phosphate oxidase family protein|nr:NimC/NimA family protein [Anaerocolumna sp.]